MVSVPQIGTPDAIRRIQRVQTVTIAWMSVEAVVSLFAAWRALSPALLAFGGDSAIELFSAVVSIPTKYREQCCNGQNDYDPAANSVNFLSTWRHFSSSELSSMYMDKYFTL